MSGYRQHSFDPMAGNDLGRPIRPYNTVQWFGVVLQLLSLCVYGYHFAAKADWVADPGFETIMFGLPLLIVGMVLVYSRREDEHDLAPELAAARRRWLIIITVLCVALIAVAAAIELLGA